MFCTFTALYCIVWHAVYMVHYSKTTSACNSCTMLPCASLTVLLLQVNRGVKSPLDISMDTSLIVDTLGFTLTPFYKVVQETFAASP